MAGRPGPPAGTKKQLPEKSGSCCRVDDGARTHDTRNHNPMLYQLNYIHHIGIAKVYIFYGFASGTLIFLTKIQIVRNYSYLCRLEGKESMLRPPVFRPQTI